MTRLWWCGAAAVLVTAGLYGGPRAADDSLLSRVFGAVPLPNCYTTSPTVDNPCEWDGNDQGYRCLKSTQKCPDLKSGDYADKSCESVNGNYCQQVPGCLPRGATQQISTNPCAAMTIP
jgi:hypothetical protein